MVLMGHCHCKSPTPKYNPKNGGVEWRIGREAAGRWRALLEARAASLFDVFSHVDYEHRGSARHSVPRMTTGDRQ